MFNRTHFVRLWRWLNKPRGYAAHLEQRLIVLEKHLLRVEQQLAQPMTGTLTWHPVNYKIAFPPETL